MEFKRRQHRKLGRESSDFDDVEIKEVGRQRIDQAELDDALHEIEQDVPRHGRQRKFKRRRSPLRKLWLAIKLSLLLVVLVFGFLAVRALIAGGKIVDRSGDIRALALRDSFDLTELNGEGDGRVNILLIGIGGEGHAGGELSDVNMVVSIDPISKDVAMLSVPRDLYVPIPGEYSARINTAHFLGEQSRSGGGPTLAAKTVEKVLGVPIHYYVRADFKGFEDAVDAVGGIDVDVDKALYDPSFPDKRLSGYEPFRLAAGPQKLDGRTALKFARCRKGNCGDDYGRAQRQQQALVGLKNKALSLETLRSPRKINQLISATGDHVKTDLNLREIVKLSEIAGETDNSKIKNEVIGKEDADGLIVNKNIGGASVLVPRLGAGNFSEIQAFARQLFIDGFIKQEVAKVVVLNGTQTPGMATKTGELLKSYGYNVIDIGDVDNNNDGQTQIVHIKHEEKQTKKTQEYLKRRFKTTVSKNEELATKYPEADIIIVIGSDYNPK